MKLYDVVKIDNLKAKLSSCSQQILSVKPFDWQLRASAALMTGDNVVLDVGTGCGKSLVFQLPLLINKTNINLVISPLSALMIDQVCQELNIMLVNSNLALQASLARLSTVAVCCETLENIGHEKMYGIMSCILLFILLADRHFK